MKTGCTIKRDKTPAQALSDLLRAVDKITKEVRWHPYLSKINDLRRPLAEYRIAVRNPD